MSRLLPQPMPFYPGTRTKRLKSLINLLTCVPCQLPPETSVLPDRLLFAGGMASGGGEVLGRGRRGWFYAFLEMVMAPKAQGQRCCLQLLTDLAFALKGICGIWKHSCALKAPSAPWRKLPTQRLNFPLLLYKEQSLVLKSPNKLLLSQTQTRTPKCLVLLRLL